MYDDPIFVRCVDAFACHVDDLYEEARIGTHGGLNWIEESTTGMFHQVGDEIAAAALAELSRRALAAKAKFAIVGPWWAQPLPTTLQKVDALARVGELIESGILAPDYHNGRMELLGNFIASWCASKWNLEHPSFDRFAKGKMADRLTPRRLRNDPDLKREYPPQRLPELMPLNMIMALNTSEALVARKARLRESNT
jgi:hypothetical protein